MRLVYRTTFINNAIIAIPEDIYSTIKSSEMILRVNKRSEYKTYTTSVIIDGRNFTNTITTYRGGLIRSDGISSVFNADIPKAKAFQISVSPSSQNPFTLEVYDKRW